MSKLRLIFSAILLGSILALSGCVRLTTKPAGSPTAAAAIQATAAPSAAVKPMQTPAAVSPLSSALLLSGNGKFRVQDSPKYIQNFAHLDKGCNWMGVGGQALDEKGQAVENVVVSITGALSGNTLDILTMTGLAKAYGPGGYEVQLSAKPVVSNGSLIVQLFNLQGKALSDPYPLKTQAECSSNLVLLNFQFSGSFQMFFPLGNNQ